MTTTEMILFSFSMLTIVPLGLIYLDSVKQNKLLAGYIKLMEEQRKQIELQQKDYESLADSFKTLADKYKNLI